MNLLSHDLKAKALAPLRGRSLWVARFSDGREVGEWEVDWAELPRKGLQELRLYCPNGELGTLTAIGDGSDRLFQFKHGMATSLGEQAVRAHVIGLIHSLDGTCQCYAWEWPGRLVRFRDRWQGGISRYGPVAVHLNKNVIGVPD